MVSLLYSLHIFSYSLSTSLLFSCCQRSVVIHRSVYCSPHDNSLSLSVGCFFHLFYSTFLCGHACVCVCVSMSVCMHVASKCMCTSLDWLSGARERGNDITYNEEKQIKLYVEFNALDIAWLFLC